MTTKLYKVIPLTLLALLLVPAFASAHEPRIKESRLTQVQSPEVSKAYYGKLTGEPDVYVIKATEAFDSKEGINALTVIPKLKKNFFEESPIGFIVSPFGWGLIVVMYLLAGIVGLLYRSILKRFAKNSPSGANKNIGKPDRLIRLAIGVGLLLWSITTTWNPILIFFSGFALFEAIFSWCGFYAAIGKNTCPR